MAQRILNFLFCVLTMNGAFGQNNCIGLVQEADTPRAIPFAEVIISNDKQTITLTDHNGKFEFQGILSDSVSLRVTCRGYYPFDTILLFDTKMEELTIKLAPDSTVTYETFEILLSSYNKQGALRDIQNGDIKLLLPGGLVGAPALPNDSIFEAEYNLTFIHRGCVRSPEENETAYNLEIFNYLDNQYGTDWRKEIRTDVIGFKK